MSRKLDFIESSGNVFADLGFKDAAERLAKAKIAIHINDIISQQGWLQAEAAKKLGINQPKISALKHGRLEGFSMERLLHFLNLLNQDVHIIIRKGVKAKRNMGRLVVDVE